jgi:hypothetical protein
MNMGSEVIVYLRLGLSHIADLAAYDHIVFLLALSAVYTLEDWRRVAWLVTAFTVGHTLTLILATLGWVVINDRLVEMLIPATILAASVENILSLRKRGSDGNPATFGRPSRYGLTLLFGLIHGLGFSNFLRALLGSEESLAVPLLSFNIGLEVGQLIIVSIVLIAATLAQRAGASRRDWVLLMSGAAAGIGFVMLCERLFGL